MSTAVFRCVLDCIWNVMAHEQKNHISSLQPNGRVHLNRHWVSVQLTSGSWGVRISGNNAGYSMFQGSVKGTGYPQHSTVSLFNYPSLRHRVPSHFNCTLKLSAHNTPTISPQHKPQHYNTHTVFFLALSLCVSHIHIFCEALKLSAYPVTSILHVLTWPTVDTIYWGYFSRRQWRTQEFCWGVCVEQIQLRTEGTEIRGQ